MPCNMCIQGPVWDVRASLPVAFTQSETEGAESEYASNVASIRHCRHICSLDCPRGCSQPHSFAGRKAISSSETC